MYLILQEVELSDIGDLLLRSYSKLKGLQYLRYHTSLWKPNNTQDINFKLRQHSVNNQKQKAFREFSNFIEIYPLFYKDPNWKPSSFFYLKIDRGNCNY